MLGDSNNQAVSTNAIGGAEYNTSHPIMLLQIKGKRERRKGNRRGRKRGREKEGERGREEGGEEGERLRNVREDWNEREGQG